MAWSQAASAHFGMLIPSSQVVESQADSPVELTLSFGHPMEGNGMDMAKPESFLVDVNGKKTVLTSNLSATEIMGHHAWRMSYPIKEPGLYQFIMSPKPYWEPAENRYIIHYTKTFVSAFGIEEGWDRPAGIKMEIVPLSRPFASYAGTVFSGQVFLDGKPAPGTMVEIEYDNRQLKYEAPNSAMTSLKVKADSNGVFTAGIPFAGWWGFAALTTTGTFQDHQGKTKPAELGAVLWMEFLPPSFRKQP